MNYSLSAKKYIENEINSKTLNDNPHKIIFDVLAELKHNLSLLSFCLENKNCIDDVKSKSFSKSLKAIYILQTSLNMKAGGEIAENLFNLYDFCRITIIKSFTKQDHQEIKKLIPIVSEILDGWKSIKN